jgi:hypothetical protein
MSAQPRDDDRLLVLHEVQEESHFLRGLGVALALSVPMWAGVVAAVRAVLR